MELRDIRIQSRKSLTLPWEEVQIMPVGDVQCGTLDCDEDRLRRQIDWALEQEVRGGPPIYYLGMGDYVDCLSPSNRQAWRATPLYDVAQQMMADKAEEYAQRFLKLVDGTHGRWLGLLEGHHFFQFEDGTTSDTRIAKALGTTHLGTCAFVRLRFVQSTARMTCTIWCHHGTGSGAMAHSPLNKLYPVMHAFDADVYLMGHQTKKAAAPVPRIYMSEKPPYKLIARKKIIAGTGGFSRGYMQGSRAVGNPDLPRGGYVEQGMMTPVTLGGIIIKVRPVWTKPPRLDINVEI